jgi:amidophosphoribosyltransferase
VEEIAASIGADSLQYISEEGMIKATEQPRERLCTACFTGDYPIPLPGEDERGKHLLEKPAATPDTDPASTVDPAERPGAVGEDPGPGASLEALLTETDRTPL